jgi:hypothetical protein
MNTPIPENLPNLEENEAWMGLCRDPRWNYQSKDGRSDENSLYFGEGWECQTGVPEFHQGNKIIVVPAPEDMHRGAVAPKFVFEADAENEPVSDGMSVYMRRLICILCKRFVIISRPNDDDALVRNQGMPQDGTRYWWRYWDNQGNVYQVNNEKFRNSAGPMRGDQLNEIMYGIPPSYRDLREATFMHGMPPGDFYPTVGEAWMRMPASMTSIGEECTNRSSFFDHAWSFTHHGTTLVPLWDACLMHLSALAGGSPEMFCRSCVNTVEDALRRCSRCKLVHYCNNNFCQREDWPEHKRICKYFKKKEEATLSVVDPTDLTALSVPNGCCKRRAENEAEDPTINHQ